MLSSTKNRFGALPFVALLACGPSASKPSGSEGDPTGVPTVYTVNYPLQYFAQRIGGDRVRAVFPAPHGVDPATWSPSPEDVAGFQKASRVLLDGADRAGWVEGAKLPASRLVNTSRAFEARLIEAQMIESQGDVAREGTTLRPWLDPTLAVQQVRVVQRALTELLPQHAGELGVGADELERDLRDLDARFERAFASGSPRPLLASRPVFDCLRRRYALDLVSLDWGADEMPDEEAWSELARSLEGRPARWMLWEDEPLPATAARLRELGVEPIVFLTCANVPAPGDYLDGMRKNASALELAFR